MSTLQVVMQLSDLYHKSRLVGSVREVCCVLETFAVVCVCVCVCVCALLLEFELAFVTKKAACLCRCAWVGSLTGVMPGGDCCRRVFLDVEQCHLHRNSNWIRSVVHCVKH